MTKINTIERLITVLSALKANIATYQTEVGATAADITFINTALANVTYVEDYSNDVDVFKRGVFQIKQTAVYGEITETVAPYPVVAAGASPTPLVAGYLELVLTMIRRFKLGPGYNHDIGVALGFESIRARRPILRPSRRPPTLSRPPRELCSRASSEIVPIRICGSSRYFAQAKRPGKMSVPSPANQPT